MFCPRCGASNDDQAAFCKQCGAALKGAAQPPAGSTASPTATPGGASAPVASTGGKNKTASVLLAVFLAYWTWLYTYKKDATKFWIGLALSIVIGILNIAGIGAAGIFTGIISLGIWIWAIVDTARKDRTWYNSY